MPPKSAPAPTQLLLNQFYGSHVYFSNDSHAWLPNIDLFAAAKTYPDAGEVVTLLPVRRQSILRTNQIIDPDFTNLTEHLPKYIPKFQDCLGSLWPHTKMVWSLSIKIKSVTCAFDWNSLGLYSLLGRTSYRKIWWSFEATRFAFIRAVEMPVKFQNDVIIQYWDFDTSRDLTVRRLTI